jgi:hypothetical protein
LFYYKALRCGNSKYVSAAAILFVLALKLAALARVIAVLMVVVLIRWRFAPILIGVISVMIHLYNIVMFLRLIKK